MLFKISDLNEKNTDLVAADSLEKLKKEASEVLGFGVVKIVRYSDGLEIKRDAILKELSKDKELHLIGLAENEKFSDAIPLTTKIKDSVKISRKSMNTCLRSEFEYDGKPEYVPKMPENNDNNEEDKGDDDTVQDLSVLKRELADFKRNLEKPKMFEKHDKIDDEVVITTEKFEEMKKEKQEKLKKAEDDKRKNEERMAELKTYDESLLKAEKEIEDLEKEISEKKREISRIKMKTKSELELTKSEIAKLEMEKIELKIRKAKISLIFKEFAKAEKVDLCFLVDCTGSMKPYINEAKMVIHRITDKLKKSFADFALRCAFVGYRDIDDGKDRTTVLPFTSSNDSFKSFVNGVNATGGADECEDVFGGLEEVTQLEWKNKTRVLFHIGDAPCHGNRFHTGANDSYPSGDPNGLNIRDLMQSLKNNDIHYWFAEINNSTLKMIEEFNKELSFVYGSPITVVKMESAADMTETVTTAVSSSIHSTKSMSMATTGEDKKIKDLLVDRVALTWSKSGMKRHEAEFFKSKFVGGIENIKNKEAIQFDRENVEIYIANSPFAKGALRYASSAILIHRGKEKKCVVKETIFNDSESNSFKAYRDIIECQLVAAKLSKIFIEKCSKSPKSIEFLDVNLLQVHDTGKYYTIENYMGESFEKWNNNVGFINEKIYANTLDAFSHWTHHITDGYLLVSDLQGFVSGTEYILTDPAICSIDYHRFSYTNLGKKGIKKYFESHKCNEHCVAYGLSKHAEQPSDVRIGGTKIIY